MNNAYSILFVCIFGIDKMYLFCVCVCVCACVCVFRSVGDIGDKDGGSVFELGMYELRLRIIGMHTMYNSIFNGDSIFDLTVMSA